MQCCLAVLFTCQVDGFIARTFPSQMSMLGSILDPLADKCLLSVLCITLTVVGLIPCEFPD